MKEIRTATVEASGVSNMTLCGYAIRFDSPTVIRDPAGDFVEVIERGALDHTVLDDSTLCVEHDTTRVPLARSPRTMQLVVNDEGLYVRAELADTERAREAYEAVRRGDIPGFSFAFTVDPSGSSYDPATNTRRISRIQKIYELSLCAHPAYSSTSVEARSQMQAQRGREQLRQELLAACDAITRNHKTTHR